MIKIHPNLTGFVRPSEHSTYSPSSMDRIIGCPASIRLTKDIPNETTSYAEEGTLAHSYCEELFWNKYMGTPISHEVLLKMAQSQDGGIEIQNAAEFYTEVIFNMLKSHIIGKVLWFGLEKGIPIFPEEGAFGTADCVIVGENAAVIIDFKFGSKSVNADSLQLRSYLAGLARYLDGSLATENNYKFIAIVVQPRTDAFEKIHEYSAGDMIETLNSIHEAIQKTKIPDLAPVKDNKWCFWCPARRTKDPNLKCPIYKAQADEVLKNDFKGFLADMSAPVRSL